MHTYKPIMYPSLHVKNIIYCLCILNSYMYMYLCLKIAYCEKKKSKRESTKTLV